MDGYEDAFINEAEEEHVKPKDAESAAGQARHLTSVAGQRHGHGYCVFYNLVKFPKTFIPKTTESFAPFPYPYTHLITTSTVSSIRQQSSC